MVKKSFTRVTLALDIIRRIENGPFGGYHELGIIKHQVDLFDEISIEDASKTQIECDNPLVPLDKHNICWRAVDLVREEFEIDKHVSIHIQKKIPVMGGLAGGSANGATTLMLLNELWNLGMNIDMLMKLGRRVGMDVPYYFTGRTAFDSETSDFPKAVPTDLKFVFILAVPDFGVATKDAYRGIDYSIIGRDSKKTEVMKKSFLENDRGAVLATVHNDFELSVFSAFPKLAQIKDELLQAGCVQAVMSGSGSTILGIAEDFRRAEEICRKLSFRTILTSTLSGVIS